MQVYPRQPMASHVDRLQTAVYYLTYNYFLFYSFLSNSYHVVELIHIQIGLIHHMELHFFKYLNHAVKKH
jgi:hypothetical protein